MRRMVGGAVGVVVVAAGVLLLSGCGVNGAVVSPSSAPAVVTATAVASPSPSGSAEVLAVLKSDLTNDKTAVAAFAAAHDGLLPSRDLVAGAGRPGSELRQYGWSQQSVTQALAYTPGSGSHAGVFCLVGSAAAGVSAVITSNTVAVAGVKCPAVVNW